MGTIALSPVSDKFENSEEVLRALKGILQDLEDQLNDRTQLYVETGGRIPSGLSSNDVLFSLAAGAISVFIKNTSGFTQLFASHLGGLMANSTNFLGFTETAANPTTTEYPTHLNWGFHRNSAGPTIFLVLNYSGTIFKVQLT